MSCTQVMKLRRRYDELTAEVSALLQQRELLLTQMSDDKAEWEKLQRVSSVAGCMSTCRNALQVLSSAGSSCCEQTRDCQQPMGNLSTHQQRSIAVV
jgi:hypothetical protein